MIDITPVAALDNIVCVGDLTDEHLGWSVQVSDPQAAVGRRSHLLWRLRRWEYEGVGYVGIISKADKGSGYSGTEYVYPSSTPCQLERQVMKRWAKAVSQVEVEPLYPIDIPPSPLQATTFPQGLQP